MGHPVDTASGSPSRLPSSTTPCDDAGAYYRAAIESTADGFLVTDADGRIVEANRAFIERSGYSLDELRSMRIPDLYASKPQALYATRAEHVKKEGRGYFESDYRAKTGEVWHAEITSSFWPIAGGRFFAFVRDLDARDRANQILRAHVELVGLSRSGSVDGLLQAGLDWAERLTGSQIGFFHFVEPDGETVRLQTGSTRTQALMAAMAAKGRRYPVEETGVWTDCLRTRATVVHNDYASLPHRRGLPEGHVSLVREMTVPVLRDGQVVAILGVGNKPADYGDQDVASVETLASLLMELVAHQRTERALREQETAYRIALDAAGLGTWSFDHATGLITLDARAASLHGFEPGTMPRERLFETFHPEDGPRILREGVSAGGGRVRREARVVRPDGSIRWLAAESQRTEVADVDGRRAVRTIGTSRDITDEKLAQAALIESEARYRSLLETSFEGMWEIDVFGRLTLVDAKTASMFGRPLQEIVGRGFTDFMAPEERARFVVGFERLIGDGVPYHGLEATLVRGDGEAIVVETSGHPMVDREGNVTGYRGVIRDVTEERRAQRELARIVASNPAVIFVTAVTPTSARLTWVSPNVEALLGYTREEVLAPGWREAHTHAEDRERVEAAHTPTTICPGQPLEFRFRHKDGRWLWIHDEHRAAPRSGDTYEIVGSWNDVTARVELEAQLLQAQKMEAVGQLAGGVAHDFNNLLTVIVSSGEYLRSAVAHDAELCELVDDVRGAAARAGALTRQLLAFSRRQILQPRVLDLNEAVTGIERMLRRLIGEDIAFTTTLASNLPPVLVDPGQLEQVIMNLAVNARDAMPKGGRLALETQAVSLTPQMCRCSAERQPGRYATLTLRDDGVGMPPEVLARIFEPFFTTKGSGKGTGLGLSTVFGIVRQSGGFIEVESTVGVGTTFTVFLPTREAAPEKGTTTGEGRAGAGSETLLLVEDEEAVRRVAARILTRAGFRVLEAADGASALSMLDAQGESIHCLVTDLVMPGISGAELASAARGRRPALKVLFVSGYSDEAIGRYGFVVGSTALLQKPFSPRALTAKVREVLDARE